MNSKFLFVFINHLHLNMAGVKLFFNEEFGNEFNLPIKHPRFIAQELLMVPYEAQ